MEPGLAVKHMYNVRTLYVVWTILFYLFFLLALAARTQPLHSLASDVLYVRAYVLCAVSGSLHLALQVVDVSVVLAERGAYGVLE